jgi:hypothetical protein
MSWKACFKEVCHKQTQPMHQITHWAMFLAVGITFALKTVETTAAASYELILQNPDIAASSWLVGGFFM